MGSLTQYRTFLKQYTLCPADFKTFSGTKVSLSSKGDESENPIVYKVKKCVSDCQLTESLSELPSIPHLILFVLNGRSTVFSWPIKTLQDVLAHWRKAQSIFVKTWRNLSLLSGSYSPCDAFFLSLLLSLTCSTFLTVTAVPEPYLRWFIFKCSFSFSSSLFPSLPSSLTVCLSFFSFLSFSFFLFPSFPPSLSVALLLLLLPPYFYTVEFTIKI